MPRSKSARKLKEARDAAEMRVYRETNSRLARGGRIRLTDREGRHVFVIAMTPDGDGLEVRGVHGSLTVEPVRANAIIVYEVKS